MTEKVITIYDNDLNENKYDEKVLIQNIRHLNKKLLLLTQILTAEFCVKYIAVYDTDGGSEDSYTFDTPTILEAQPHITKEEYVSAYYKIYRNRNNKN